MQKAASRILTACEWADVLDGVNDRWTIKDVLLICGVTCLHLSGKSGGRKYLSCATRSRLAIRFPPGKSEETLWQRRNIQYKTLIKLDFRTSQNGFVGQGLKYVLPPSV